MEILIITGMSGAGKSQAGKIIEDIGYYVIDNMPPSLIPIFADMAARLGQLKKAAIVTDMRAGNLFSGFFGCLEELTQLDIPHKILYLDAADEAVARRYRETRRSHPIPGAAGAPISDAIAEERKILMPIREVADHYIDTTQISVEQLREMLEAMFLENVNDSLRVVCMSFGFKYSIPMESNMVLDVRHLPNPFYVEALRFKTGLEKEVRDYVFSFPETSDLLRRIGDLIGYLLPLYKREGKTRLIVSVGCTGGKHRSVAVVEALAKHIETLSFSVSVMHRDISKTI